MHPVEALERLGGIASTQQLLAMTTRKRMRGALARGEIRRSVRGRYILPSVGQARRCAAAAGGHLILLSAAQHHESTLRAIAIDEGLGMLPQFEVVVGLKGRSRRPGRATRRTSRRVAAVAPAERPFADPIALGRGGYPPSMTQDRSSQQAEDQHDGQVSEVSGMDPADADTPIQPSDATAGSPDGESGEPQEGEAGPDAKPAYNKETNEFAED